MSGKRWKMLIYGAVGAIVGLLVFSVFLASRTPEFPTLPNPNGYYDLVAASQSITGPVGDYQKLTTDELRKLLAANDEALRRSRIGLSRTCSVPTEAVLKDLSASLPQVGGFRQLAQLLAAEGRLAELENRPGDAAQSYAEVIRLGNEISHGGLLIHRLVGIAVQAIGGTWLATIIPQLTPTDARDTLQLLDSADQRAVSWEEVLRSERLCVRYELRKNPNPVIVIVSWWKSRPAIRRARTKHDTALAHVRLMATELALRCYQADTGRVAASIQDLVPKYLPCLPVDPLSEQPFQYQPQATNWVLYSFGPDRVDDGGSSLARGAATGDVLYSSPW